MTHNKVPLSVVDETQALDLLAAWGLQKQFGAWFKNMGMNGALLQHLEKEDVPHASVPKAAPLHWNVFWKCLAKAKNKVAWGSTHMANSVQPAAAARHLVTGPHAQLCGHKRVAIPSKQDASLAGALEHGILAYLNIHAHSSLRAVCSRMTSIQYRVSISDKSKVKRVAVPFPGFPGLFQTPEGIEHQRALFPHQVDSVTACLEFEHQHNGGIHASEPGMGKTPTTIALICHTAAEFPPTCFPREHLDAPLPVHLGLGTARGEGISRLMRQMNHYAQDHKKTEDSEEILACRLELRSEKCQTTCQAIRRCQSAIARLKRATPADRLRMGDCVEYEGALMASSVACIAKFRVNPISRHELAKLLRTDRLIGGQPIRSTLIIVPDALLNHWCEMFRQHLNLQQFSQDFGTGDGRGIVYVDGFGDLNDTDNLSWEHTRKDWKQMPRAEALWGNMVVIVTFSRLSWIAKQLGDTSSRRVPLLEFFWKRLIVDEGHEIGNRDTIDPPSFQLLCRIRAQLRWAMTGTPAGRGGPLKQQLEQIHALLLFLRHPVYGAVKQSRATRGNSSHHGLGGGWTTAGFGACGVQRDDGVANGWSLNAEEVTSRWEAEIQGPMLKHDARAREKLRSVLSSLIVMHQKKSIDLPLPSLSEQFLPRVDGQLKETAMGERIVHLLAEAKKQNPDAKLAIFSEDQQLALRVSEYLERELGPSRMAAFFRQSSAWNSSVSGIVDGFYDLARFRDGKRRVRECPLCGYANSTHVRVCQRKLVSATYRTYELRATLYSKANNAPAQTRLRQKLLTAIPKEAYVLDIAFRTEGHQVEVCVTTQAHLDPKLQKKLCSVMEDSVPATLTACRATLLDIDIVAERERVTLDSEQGDLIYVDLSEPFQPAGTHHLGCRTQSVRSRRPRAWWVDHGLMDPTRRQDVPILGPLAQYNICNQVVATKGQALMCSKVHPRKWFHGAPLKESPVMCIEEDVDVLVLGTCGWQGLDLSFLTHIVLLDRVEDLPMRNQIVSRANRMGATVSVAVQTIVTATQYTGSAECRIYCSTCYNDFESKHAFDAHPCRTDPDQTTEAWWSVAQICAETRRFARK